MPTRQDRQEWCMMAEKKRDETVDEPDEGIRLLRDDAEDQLVRSPKFSHELKGKTPEKLIHELQVHQIELEMQAEELRNAKLALEESRDKFLDLYDFAPLGYLTLSDKALITEVNLTATTLLGIERNKLLKVPFSKYVAEKDIDEWYWFFTNMLNQEEKRSCTLTLIRSDGSTFPARLESLRIADTTKGTLTVRVAISDITDIRKAEVVQKNQHSLLKAILESTGSAVFSLDRNYRYTSFNSHHAMVMKQLYGADIELGRSISDYQSVNEDRILAQLNINRALAGEQFTLEAFSGEETRLQRYFEVTHYPVKDAGNNVTGVAIFAQDITDRKRAEDSIRQSEERYRRITEGLTDYLYTVNVQDGKVVSTTHGAACTAVTGYTAEEFSADPYLWINMVFDEDRDRVSRHFSGVLLRKPVPPIEHRIVRKDGQIRWVRDTPIIHLDADGRLVSYDGVIKDITERKQAEEAVRHLTEFQESVITNALVWLSVLDPSGKILVWNTAATEISGYRSEEVIGSNAIWKLLYPEKEYRKQVTTTINRIISEKKYLENFETIIRTKEGNEKIISWNTKGIPDKSGKTADYIVIGMDVTDRHRAEEQLNKTVDELRRFNKLTVDRELRMIALKQEINALLKKTGEPEKYRNGS
jgi:PAS domain S-box-containing protein